MPTIAKEIASLLAKNSNFRFLCLGFSVYSLSWNMVYFLLPLYTESIGIDLTQTASILSAMGVGAIFSAPISGFLADRYGRKWIMITGWGFLSAALAWLLFARNPSEIAIAMLMWGAATGMSTTAILPLLTESSNPSKLGSTFGYFMGFTGIVSGIGPVMAGYMAEATSFRFPFTVAAFMAPASVILALNLKEEPKNNSKNANGVVTQRASSVGAVLTPKRPIALLVSWVAFFLITAIGNQILVPLLPRYLEFKIGANAADAGVVFTAIGLLNALIFIPGGKVADKYDKAKLIAFSQLVATPPMLLLAMTANLMQVVAVITVVIIVGNIGWPAAQSYFMESFHAGHRGKASGFVAMTNPSSQIVGPLIAAGLWGLRGPDWIIYSSTATFPIAVLPLVLVARWRANGET